MQTTTEKTPLRTAAQTHDPHLCHQRLGIAEPHELKYALEVMFYAYVWRCTGRGEEDHNNICFIFHGLIHECEKLEKAATKR